LDSIAYVNGSFVPLSEAKVSILDRGFLFADGIYEVAAVLDGKLVDNASHLARLKRSVGEISLELPESLERIEEIQKELVARNKHGEVDRLDFRELRKASSARRHHASEMRLDGDDYATGIMLSFYF
jgi:branched-subunit amino acid aminotransferase/4-amino-4-deoxychorismate lyase